MGRPAERVSLRDGERKALEALARRSREERSVAFRARIVLRCAEGLVDTDVARLLRTSHTTVGTWRRRFNARRLDGLLDEPRPGAPRRIDDAKIELVVRTTLESLPKDATHWSTRELARKLGMSHSAVARVWRAFGLRPHRAETFALSKDPLLVDKVRDIVGLYLSPPANALVLCVDEKSQIQALERSQPVIPMTIGQVELRTHDYVRHGTTTLFAALDVATGNVVGSCKPRHRSEEFLAFLREVDRATPEALDLHLVLDNYATHKTQAVTRLAPAPPPVQAPLHAHARLLAQPGRAVVRPALPAQDQAGEPHQRRGPGGGHRLLHRRPQREPQALPVGQGRRRDPRLHRAVRHPDQETRRGS